jgi:hypothetical protein
MHWTSIISCMHESTNIGERYFGKVRRSLRHWTKVLLDYFICTYFKISMKLMILPLRI